MTTLTRRFFGKTNIELDAITFGTMRFSPDRVGTKVEALALLELLYEQGIRTYHTSHEYETHAYFCEVFKEFKARRQLDTVHIVKLACPHFEEEAFSEKQLEKKIDEQLSQLGIDCIDILQWLFRQKNNVDEIRIPKMHDSMEMISSSFQRLIKAGKVKSLACFPYTLSFAKQIQQYSLVDGFVDYLNILERGWVEDLLSPINSGFIAIRPLCSGKVLRLLDLNKKWFSVNFGLTDPVSWAIGYPLLNSKVSSVILSLSTKKHAKLAIDALKTIETNEDLFRDISSAMNANLEIARIE